MSVLTYCMGRMWSTYQEVQNFSFKFDSISLFLTLTKKLSCLGLSFLMISHTLGC